MFNRVYRRIPIQNYFFHLSPPHLALLQKPQIDSAAEYAIDEEWKHQINLSYSY